MIPLQFLLADNQDIIFDGRCNYWLELCIENNINKTNMDIDQKIIFMTDDFDSDVEDCEINANNKRKYIYLETDSIQNPNKKRRVN